MSEATLKIELKAAQNMDWMQTRLNGAYGPPCFHLEPEGRFCGRAQGWHNETTDAMFHKFTPLASFVKRIATLEAALREAKQECERLKDMECIPLSPDAPGEGDEAKWMQASQGKGEAATAEYTLPITLRGRIMEATIQYDTDRPVPAENFCRILAANVSNGKMSDTEFREFIKRTLDIVNFSREPLPVNPWACLNGYLPNEPIEVVVSSRCEDKRTGGFMVKPHHITARKPVGTHGTFHGVVPGGGGDIWWVYHDDGSIGAYIYLTELVPA